MADQIELTLLGFASVVDTVLLLVTLERVNRPLIPVWIAILLLAAWTWHAGSFVHVLLRDSVGILANWADCTTLSAMAAGLLLLPSGMLHGALRLRNSGPAARPPWNLRDKLELPGSRSLLLQIMCCLVAITGLTIVYVVISDASTSTPMLRTIVTLSLLIPAICFAWSIFHRRLMPLIMERTLGYGAILVAMLWLHRTVVSPVTDQLSEDLNLDFVLIEFVVLLALLLSWRPLRNRVRESLHYLIGTDISQVRDATRQLSSQLLVRSNDRMEQMLEWFAESTRMAMRVDSVWLGLSCTRFFHATTQPTKTGDNAAACHTIDAADVYGIRFPNDKQYIDQTRCRDTGTTEQLRNLRASAAFQFKFRNIRGRLLLGRLDGGDRFSTEQLNSLTLLLDQFAVTVHNRELDKARQLAERRAMQQEKLSVLGLMSGSLAHELKNPLSSIRTISTLLMEDLGESSIHYRDVQLIVSEIDRLTETANGLLQYSRPPDATATGVCAETVIERLLRILRYLARQHGVSVITEFQASGRPICGNDATLSEMFLTSSRTRSKPHLRNQGRHRSQSVPEVWKIRLRSSSVTMGPESRRRYGITSLSPL